MTRRQFFVALVVLFISVMSSVLNTPSVPGRAAWAQETATVKEVRAERFVLVDQAGRDRAELTMVDEQPMLRLLDEAGVARAQFGFGDVGAEGVHFFEPELSLLDADGQKRAVVNLVAGHPQLMLLDEMGNILVNLAAMAPLDVSLSMYDSQSQRRMFFGYSGIDGDDPEISMADSAGNMRAALRLIDGGPVLRLLDEAKVVRASLNLLDDWPKLVITDPSGLARTSIGYPDFPSVDLYDDDGNIGAALSIMEGRPTLGLFDEGKARGVFGLDASGSPSLSLLNAEGHLRAALGSTTTENTETGAVTTFPISTITLFGDNGRVQWQAP